MINHLKNSKTDVYNGIGTKMFSVSTPVEAMKLVREDNYAYVESRDSLLIEIEKSPLNTYHLPPTSEESTFFLDYIAIAFNKKFNGVQYFNRM